MTSPPATIEARAKRLMKTYFRLAVIDGRANLAAGYQHFYLFAPSAVRHIHTSRLVKGTPPKIEHGVWFRLFNGGVVDAVTAERFSEVGSLSELFDLSVN